jgi:hypothetical protein
LVVDISKGHGFFLGDGIPRGNLEATVRWPIPQGDPLGWTRLRSRAVGTNPGRHPAHPSGGVVNLLYILLVVLAVVMIIYFVRRA